MIFFVSKSRISNFRSRNINFVYLINFTNILKSNIFVNLYKFVDTGILGLKKKKRKIISIVIFELKIFPIF